MNIVSFEEQLTRRNKHVVAIVPPELSRREREVLQWAAEGKTDWEIGMILGLSEHTADKFIRLACRKLYAANRTHAVAQAIRLGLII